MVIYGGYSSPFSKLLFCIICFENPSITRSINIINYMITYNFELKLLAHLE